MLQIMQQLFPFLLSGQGIINNDNNSIITKKEL